jgi:hypothetical protein
LWVSTHSSNPSLLQGLHMSLHPALWLLAVKMTILVYGRTSEASQLSRKPEIQNHALDTGRENKGFAYNVRHEVCVKCLTFKDRCVL